MDHPFRSATFGGFNRQDVLTYLETTSKEHNQKQEALQQQLEELQVGHDAALQELEALRQQVARLESDLKQAQADQDEARRSLEQVNAELSAARTLQTQTARDLETAQADAQRWQQSAAQLEPDAQLYRAVKERTAGVELEAHRRAQAIQEEANAQALQLHRNMEQWLAKVSKEYDALRSQVEATVSHAAAQLDRAGQSLNQVTTLLGEQDMALESLTQAYQQAE